MSLQIASLVIYNHEGERREITFHPSQLNILTGASKTGKSAIIDIIDYVTGRSECYVADGVIRKCTQWYGILFQLNESQIFIARRNPDPGTQSHGDIYIARGSSLVIPDGNTLYKNTTVNAVEKFLGTTIGINENEHRPPSPTRPSLEANFRHALLFCFQDQNDIDSKQRLFHRQDDGFIAQAIRDTLPYFLGAMDEERLLQQAQLDDARKLLRQLERLVREADSLDDTTFPRARALLEEAKMAGLADDRTVVTSHETCVSLLQSLSERGVFSDIAVLSDHDEILARLRSERQGLRTELERLNIEIRETRAFTSESTGYEREAREQRARLSIVNLIKCSDELHFCPLCQSHLENPPPSVVQLNHSLNELSLQLEAVEAENPRLQKRLADLQAQESTLINDLRENQRKIDDCIKQTEYLQVQQENFMLQARILGKIAQYLETVKDTNQQSGLRNHLEKQLLTVSLLEKRLDPIAVREKLAAFLNIIGRYMTEYSDLLDLEHQGSNLRLDIRKLTVVADTLDGPVPLFRMGSGENWVGYHILAHLALHRWFRQKKRPVPGFLILDQPSQAHYPPEKDNDGSIASLRNEDQNAVNRLFSLINHAAQTLAPDLQIIVMDHADLKDDWFQTAVSERWRNGVKLIPTSWITP
ncbi:DUF3732 domain-containing protein [Xenorhabdus szentirmaii]|uniref:DUF3732 domain-containing protein n=1 Tax=Xenorhabdus szentirmaii DSM 16338 TaxID=1427518 RepID=W1IRW8_9GAMM|nr:DUF3732 domain-containing protein [Xenorhabdus szentirmaii]PHM30796.1 hypothetical protein Xsze_03910 [Xenorhabdus szentirmaii DSM 16338]CDL81232.1 conserved hypothetical protein [Xenorhabdus szentirmaii DSM 16338]